MKSRSIVSAFSMLTFGALLGSLSLPNEASAQSVSLTVVNETAAPIDVSVVRPNQRLREVGEAPPEGEVAVLGTVGAEWRFLQHGEVIGSYKTDTSTGQRVVIAQGASFMNGPPNSTNVTFSNRTEVELEYFWVDPDGNQIRYGALAAKDTQTLETFVGHLWYFKEDGVLVDSYVSTKVGTDEYDLTQQVPQSRKRGWGWLAFVPVVGQFYLIAAHSDERQQVTVSGGTTPKYETTSLLPDYVGEEVPGNTIWPGSQVTYLDEAGRAPLRLHVRNGLLVDANGALFDTADAETLHRDTRAAIFVMSPTGEIYASKTHSPGVFHHSSFLAGGDVAAAGELVVNEGVIEQVTRRSGHYRPVQSLNDQFMTEVVRDGYPRISSDMIKDELR